MVPEEIPLFQALSSEQIRSASLIRRYAVQQLVFSQGEPTTGLWVILEGRCAVERVGNDGQIYTTGIWHPGELIGIAGVWDGSGYPASARALDAPTILLWMARDRFLALHRSVPAFAEAVSRALAERLRYIQELVADTRGRPAAVQLAVILATLGRRTGPDLALTHEDLARMIAAKRETVTRVLSEFQRRGWIDQRYARISIRDGAALMELATGMRPWEV